VFPGKINAHVRFLQNRTYAEPLAGAIEGICALGVFMCLPGLGLNAYCRGTNVRKNDFEVSLDRFLQLGRMSIEESLKVVGLVADGIAAQDAVWLGLKQSGIENEIRRFVRETGKLGPARLQPEPIFEQQNRLHNPRIL
jgi:hypothetical protein